MVTGAYNSIEKRWRDAPAHARTRGHIKEEYQMALNGLHVVCGVAGLAAELDGHAIALPLMSYVLHWSEKLPNAGTTTKAVPVGASRSAFRVRCGVDAYAAVGKTPVVVNGPAFFVPANTAHDIIAPNESKLAWVVT